jgi:hypothetical protein
MSHMTEDSPFVDHASCLMPRNLVGESPDINSRGNLFDICRA